MHEVQPSSRYEARVVLCRLPQAGEDRSNVVVDSHVVSIVNPSDATLAFQ